MNMNMNDDFKVVMSVGIRCHTEIILKKMGLKKFSSPFDALYLRKIDDIIDIMENKIDYDYVINTEDLEENGSIKKLNKRHGKRSIYRKIVDYDYTSPEHLYHSATFAHHNLGDIEVQKHFNRCFDRLKIIEESKLRTLFCLFLFPNYGKNSYSPYVHISNNDILKLSNYLNNKFNCKLLVLSFNNNKKSQYIINSESVVYINICSTSTNYEDNKVFIDSIFKTQGVIEDKLLKYDDI